MKNNLFLVLIFVISTAAYAEGKSDSKIKYVKVKIQDINSPSELDAALAEANVKPNAETEAPIDISLAPVLPLIEDTGSPDRGRDEDNIMTQATFLKHGETEFLPLVFDHNVGCGTKEGLFSSMECSLSTEYVMKRDAGETGYRSGMGNLEGGLKWTIDGVDFKKIPSLEKWSAAIYPKVQIVPLTSSVRRDVADGGTVITVPIIVTREFNVKGHIAAVTTNLGYSHSSGENPSEWFSAIGGGIAITPLTQVVAAVTRERLFTPGVRNQIVTYQIGTTRTLSKHINVFAALYTAPQDPRNYYGKPSFGGNIGVQFLSHPQHRVAKKIFGTIKELREQSQLDND